MSNGINVHVLVRHKSGVVAGGNRNLKSYSLKAHVLSLLQNIFQDVLKWTWKTFFFLSFFRAYSLRKSGRQAVTRVQSRCA